MGTKTILWNVSDYGANHPLSEAQLQQLVSEFKLPREKLDELGTGLAHALNWRTQRRSLIKFDAAEKKGNAEFEKALAEIRSAEKKLEAALTRLESVEFFHSDNGQKVKFPSEVLYQKLTRTFSRIGGIRKSLVINAGLGTRAHFRGIADKRLERDDRRSLVCNAIFRTWVASGRNLTLTTDYVTSERRGALIDFVNAIVGMVTSPSVRLNGETIRLEIDRGKRELHRERLWEQRGYQV